MTGQHARLAPSASGRWGPGGCPGSVAMEEKYPELDDNEEALEGDAGHHALAQILRGIACPVGTIAPGGVPVNAEMIDATTEVLLDIAQVLRQATPGVIIHIEQRVFMYLNVHKDCDGTPDIFIIDFATKTIWIWDYKFGHRYVDVYRCWQIILYAIGIMETHVSPDPTTWNGWRFHVAIAQPRCFSGEGTLRPWYFGGSALVDFSVMLRKAAHDASQPDAPLVTGDHCRDCSAMVQCEANQKVAGYCVDISNRQIPADMTSAAIGFQRKIVQMAIARLKARDDGLEAAQLALIAAGKQTPGWAHEPKQGHERWALPIEQVIKDMKRFGGIDISRPHALTPTQARKEGIDPVLIKEYAERPSGGLKLTPIDSDDFERQLGTR